MSISKEDKTDLTDINHRFLNYVSKVRHLKKEEDLSIINQSITMLEEELNILKSSYESQICQLKTTLDIILTQKLDLEKELLSRKNNECHLNDRLMVENSKNSKLLHELSCLRSDISSGEQEIISLNLIIKQLRLERGDVEANYDKLARSLQEANAKNFKLEEKIRDCENQISCMTQKIEFQDHFFSEKVKEMKLTQEAYTQKISSMDHRIKEADLRESQWPDILEKIQETAAEEYNKYKYETEKACNGRISYLQQQLESEISDNNQLKQAAETGNAKILEMRKQEAELHSTIDCLQRRIDILEKALVNDKNESERVIQALQNKIRQLQQHITMEIDQARNGKSLNNNVSIRGEIEFIKRLLTEEEHRLNIKPEYHSNEEILTFSKENDSRNKDGSEDTKDRLGENDGKSQIKIEHFHPTGSPSDMIPMSDNYNVGYVSEEEFGDENNNRYINNISYEENMLYESDFGAQKKNEADEFYVIKQENNYTNHIDEIKGFGDADTNANVNYWTDKPEGVIVKYPLAVGPISHPESIVGPIRPVSSTPYPPSVRPPRPLSANLRGMRTKSCLSHQDINNKDCTSRNSNNFSDSGIGQSPDYFDSLFNPKQESLNITDPNETSLSSIKISEVNKDGKYIKISNSSDKYDAEIGGYVIKQNRFGHPISMFRFPDRVKLPAKSTATVWSGSNDPLSHQPPTDFYSSQPLVWGSSPEFTTILCNTFGQALFWTSTAHRINPDPYRAKTAPVSKEKKRSNSQRLPGLIPNNSTTNNDQIHLIRDDIDVVSQSFHHPFTSTPKSSIHPYVEGYRSITYGNENGLFNGQSRQQTDNMPDPVAAARHVGTKTQRVTGTIKGVQCYPPTIQRSHTINNRMPEVVFRSNTEPPNAFQKPQSRLITGLDQVQSMHNNLYCARMYKAQANPN